MHNLPEQSPLSKKCYYGNNYHSIIDHISQMKFRHFAHGDVVDQLAQTQAAALIEDKDARELCLRAIGTAAYNRQSVEKILEELEGLVELLIKMDEQWAETRVPQTKEPNDG